MPVVASLRPVGRFFLVVQIALVVVVASGGDDEARENLGEATPRPSG